MWVESGLPDACPECGEDVDLSALADEITTDLVTSAEVFCESCGHSWDWDADSGTEDAHNE
jgi:endogenous inhibitor of DNA gyrase (YacG/DUF329 family)